MSDEPRQTYSARDIVLEFFPATHKRLIPSYDTYQLRADAYGNVALYSQTNALLLTLTPVTSAGKPSTQLCCDFCQRSGSRSYLQPFRVEVPGSGGRRYLYVSLCRDTNACQVRRLSDDPVRALLSRVFS